jgi:phosphoribosylformylglycinamidine cyclo-ligase
MKLTYAASGVDIDKKSSAIESLVKNLVFARRGVGAPSRSIAGHYTGAVEFGEYAITLCTDGVGTKLLVAESMRKWKTVGIDCIAMNVNDTICIGAEPLAFVDYIALDKPKDSVMAGIGIGLNEGARQANVSIIGGETAVLPELVNGMDISGTCLGIIRKKDIISGNGIKAGDLLIGIASTGIHSNGFTLVRRIFKEAGYGYEDTIFDKKKLGDVLLEPTKIYVRGIMDLLKKSDVRGMAHITGGGLRNLLRLKKGVEFRITNPMKPQKIFKTMQELGKVDDAEMYQTFNMGMGYCVAIREKDATAALKLIRKHYDAEIVGDVLKAKKGCVTLPEKGLKYEKY